jgi:glycosyltransferase involved in cell wall biosynthesis
MRKENGPSVRIYNLTKELASLGKKVDVIIPKERDTNETLDGVVVHGVRGLYSKAMLEVFRRIMGVSRPTALYFYDLVFVNRISKLIRQVDVVQMEQQTAGALLIPFIKRVLKKPVVIDCHDTFQALRVGHTRMLRKMLETFLEKLAYRNADLILTVSELEKDSLTSVGIKEKKIEVVPNGVDPDFFKKQPKKTELLKKYGTEGFQTVVFVGNLEYLPNREAVEKLSSVIAPKVLSKVRNVKFLVVGKTRGEFRNSGLIFTGGVKSVPDLLNISDVAIAPLIHGSGTRLKILEYFSCNLPVVSTSLGAEGLDVQDGVNIFIENDMQSFAFRIVKLLRDKNLAATIGEAARKVVTERYDWKQIARNLGIVLQSRFSQTNMGSD